MDPVSDPRRPGPDRRERPDSPVGPIGPPSRSRMQPAAFPSRAEPDDEPRGRRYPDRDFERDFERNFERPDDDADFEELDGDEDLDGDERRDASPLREWLIMAGQLALGVLAGGAVWLGFNWLWGALPQAALVLALLVIAGMVLIVRKIRRAEDLQTTVFAVLVGLLATVSPVVLLLVNK